MSSRMLSLNGAGGADGFAPSRRHGERLRCRYRGIEHHVLRCESNRVVDTLKYMLNAVFRGNRLSPLGNLVRDSDDGEAGLRISREMRGLNDSSHSDNDNGPGLPWNLRSDGSGRDCGCDKSEAMKTPAHPRSPHISVANCLLAHEVVSTSTVAIGSRGCAGRTTLIPPPCFVIFSGVCSVSASK